jgi:hypothetical protein
MNKILLTALVLFAGIGVFAQEKTIDKTEFDTVFQNSFRSLSGNPRRETSTSKSSSEIIPQAKYPEANYSGMNHLGTNYPANSLEYIRPARITFNKVIREFLPGVGSRMTYEFNSPSLYKKTETIIIADKTYTREGDGQWIETMPVSHTRPESTVKTVDNQFKYKFLGTEQFNNQNANVYTVTEKSKLISLKYNRESSSNTITKYWFAEDGRLLKTESKREIRGGNTISKFHTTTLYELDPNIRIEVPIK